MLNHRIRGLLFHDKKIAILQLASTYFFGKSIQKHPDSVCVLYPKPLNERLIILLQKKKCYFRFYFSSILFLSAGSSSSAIVAPFVTAGIRPVGNRLNQDTTVYYGLVFCAFAWPYFNCHNSGTINDMITRCQDET